VLHLFNPETICKPFSRYSHGALVDGQMRWLHISGQVGARPDGTLDQGFEAQARLAWANLIAVLEAGGMARSDLVKVNVLLTRAGDVPASRKIRDEALQGAAPASTSKRRSGWASAEMTARVEAGAAP